MSNNNNNINLGAMPRIFWGNRQLNLDDLQNRLKPKHLLQHPITMENGQALPLEILRQILDLPPEAVDLVEAMNECSSSDFLDLTQTVREFHKMDQHHHGGDADDEFVNFLNFIDSLSHEEVVKLEAQEQQKQNPQSKQQQSQLLNNNSTMNQNSSSMTMNMMTMMDNSSNNNNIINAASNQLQQQQQQQMQNSNPQPFENVEQMQAQLQIQALLQSSSNQPFASI